LVEFKPKNMRFIALLLILLSQSALAERKVNIILPFTYAGTSGQVAAMIRSSLEQDGNTANVILKSGASGVVGANSLAEAKPDGSTIGVITTGVLFPTEHKDAVAYTTESFSILTSFGKQTFVVLCSRGSIEEFIGAVSGRSQSTFGATAAGQFNALRMMNRDADKTIVLVSYKDQPPLFADLASSRIAYSIATTAAANTMIQSGKVKPIAVTSPDRLSYFPGIPALSEFFSGYEYTSHVFAAAPAGLPEQEKSWLISAMRRFAVKNSAKLVESPLYLYPYAFGPEHAQRAVAADSRRYKQ
jgi:tripartite-type tricarboxylate transporter receptor subunit TctC